MPYALLFLAIPLIEIALFVVVGGVLGLWLTLGLVLLSGVLGVVLLRRSTQPGRGARRPLHEIAGRGVSVLAGILLIVPGFLTSLIGLLLLLPPVQALLLGRLGQKLGGVHFAFRQSGARPDDIIDAEFEEISEPPPQRLPPSKWTEG